VALEAGGSRLRVQRADASVCLEDFEAPAARFGELGALLHHHGETLARALRSDASLLGQLEEVVDQDGAIGEPPRPVALERFLVRVELMEPAVRRETGALGPTSVLFTCTQLL
jgi:hypothetical protein